MKNEKNNRITVTVILVVVDSTCSEQVECWMLERWILYSYHEELSPTRGIYEEVSLPPGGAGEKKMT